LSEEEVLGVDSGKVYLLELLALVGVSNGLIKNPVHCHVGRIHHFPHLRSILVVWSLQNVYYQVYQDQEHEYGIQDIGVVIVMKLVVDIEHVEVYSLYLKEGEVQSS